MAQDNTAVVKEWLAGEPEVVLEDLPSYAPALNPDEMVWAWLKYGRLANLASTPLSLALRRRVLCCAGQDPGFVTCRRSAISRQRSADPAQCAAAAEARRGHRRQAEAWG